MNTKTREEVLELLVDKVKAWPGGIMRDSDPAMCDDVRACGKWGQSDTMEIVFCLGCLSEPITEQEWREFGDTTKDSSQFGTQQALDEARTALGEFNDPDKTIAECIKMLHFSFHTALTPMLWSKEISDAWHKDLPNTKQSFTNLKSAILDIKQPPHSP